MITETIRSRATEGRTLALGEVRAVVVPIYASLSAAVPSAQPLYRVPANDFLVVRRILPHLGLSTPSTEAMNNAGAFNAGTAMSAGLVLDHMAAKAGNCRMTLRVTDDNYDLFENHPLVLAHLMRACGGGPLDYRDTPLRIRPGKTLELALALNDVAAAAIGNATEYGVVLVGALVRRRDK